MADPEQSPHNRHYLTKYVTVSVCTLQIYIQVLRDYITEERVKDRVTSTTTESITAQEHISMRQTSARPGYKVYLRGRITGQNYKVQ